MEKERKAVTKRFASLSRQDLEKYAQKPESKNRLASEKLRIQGNKLFQQLIHYPGAHEEIWESYTKSIALAPAESEELASAYANRSALFFHLGKYKDCIVDCDKAVNLTKSDILKAKWLCRKAKCFHALDDVPNAEEILHEAVAFNKKVDKDNKDAIKVFNLIEKTEKLLNTKCLKKLVEESGINAPKMKKTENDFSDVSLKYNSKYGKHLIANRDVAPGEVIFIEKPYYVSISNFDKPNPYCNHCRAVCLTTIPCKTCTWCMFCSEKCKEEAWVQYHDKECCVLKTFSEHFYTQILAQIALHTCIVECQNHGGISSLKQFLQKIDQKNDKCSENMIVDGKLLVSQFEILYSIKDETSYVISPEYTDIAVQLLVSLAANSTFFGQQFNRLELINLFNNQDVVFIASLMLKLINLSSNSVALSKVNASLNSGGVASGCCIPPVCMIANHNCDPNVFRFVNSDKNLVLFSLQPIKKDEQIFVSYTGSYKLLSRAQRKQELEQSYGFTCDCQACTDDWPSLYDFMAPLNEGNQNFSSVFKNPLEVELFDKHKNIILNTLVTNPYFHYSEQMISDLAKSLTIALKKLRQSSVIIILLMNAINLVALQLYAKSYQMSDRCIN